MDDDRVPGWAGPYRNDPEGIARSVRATIRLARGAARLALAALAVALALGVVGAVWGG